MLQVGTRPIRSSLVGLNLEALVIPNVFKVCSFLPACYSRWANGIIFFLDAIPRRQQ